MFDLTDEVLYLLVSSISTPQPECVKVCVAVSAQTTQSASKHPYQLLLVLVGMFCGRILLQCSLARCQHDLQRSESLSHVACEAPSARGARPG